MTAAMENNTILLSVDKYLLDLFQTWVSVPPTSSKIREQIWLHFSQFTSSDEYSILWTSFSNTMGVPCSPSLCFYITFNYFITTCKTMYPSAHQKTIQAPEMSHLTYDEQNALWYIGGYIIRQVRRKVETHKSKDDLLDIMDGFIDDVDRDSDSEQDDIENMESENDGARAWLNAINRGGLVKCSNNLYLVIRAIEVKLKSKLQLMSEADHLGTPHEISINVASDTAVKQVWNKIIESTQISEETTNELRTLILELYVKVRLHAFTRKTMEHFKQNKLQSIQKSKSLRSKLNAEH